MNTIPILPWFSLADREAFNEFDLIPFRRGIQIEGVGPEIRDVLEAMTSRFYIEGSRVIEVATLLKLRQREVAFAPTEEERHLIGELVEILAVGGLSYREFFYGGNNYSNRQNFQLYLQPVNTVLVGMPSRRRDGITSNHFPTASARIQKPAEVTVDSQRRVDSALVHGLLLARSSPEWTQTLEAIVCFNLANTDSPIIWKGTEAVLLVSAFERLLGKGHGKARDVVGPFRQLLVPRKQACVSSCERLVATKHSNLKKTGSVREAWLAGFFRLRNDLAHGKVKPASTAWSLDEHLLLASHIFPLTLKCFLARRSGYVLTEYDQLQIDVFEARLCKDHVGLKGGEDARFPWNQVMSDYLDQRARERVAPSAGEG